LNIANAIGTNPGCATHAPSSLNLLSGESSFPVPD
jgi:hypothetical protein